MTLALLLQTALCATPQAEVTADIAAWAETHSGGLEISPSPDEARLAVSGKKMTLAGSPHQLTLAFSKTVPADADADWFQQHFTYIVVDHVETGIAAEDWRIRAQTPVSSRRDGVSFADHEAGLAVSLDWRLFAVWATKQSPDCNPPADGSMPEACMANVERDVPLALRLALPVEMPADAVPRSTHAFPVHLRPVGTVAVSVPSSGWALRSAPVGADLVVAGGQNPGKIWVSRLGASSWRFAPEPAPMSTLDALAASETAVFAGGHHYDRQEDRMGGHWGPRHPVLVKLDAADGSALWRRAFEDDSENERADERIFDVLPTEDGGAIAVGHRLRRLDADGEVIWDVDLAGEEDFAVSVGQLPDGDLVLAGTCEHAGRDADGEPIEDEARPDGIVNVLTARFGADGTKRWITCTHGGERFEVGEQVLGTSEGQVLVAGQAKVGDGNRIRVQLLDGDGQQIWETLVGSSRVADHSPMQTVGSLHEHDGGFVMVGSNTGEDIDVEIRGGTDGLVVGLGPDGARRWQQSLGSSQFDMLTDGFERDGQLAILRRSRSGAAIDQFTLSTEPLDLGASTGATVDPAELGEDDPVQSPGAGCRSVAGFSGLLSAAPYGLAVARRRL